MINDVVTSRVAKNLQKEPSLSVRSSVSDLPLTQLARACAEEAIMYRRGEVGDRACCFELFRRAVCNRDEYAWQTIVELYRGIVVVWVRRHPATKSLGEEDDYWVDGAFVRFYQAVSPDRFTQFSSIAQIMGYLKLCVNSIVQDALRTLSKQPLTIPLDGADDLDESAGLAPIAKIVSSARPDQSLTARELWHAVDRLLLNDVERRVAYLAFVLEYKPREIQALHPTLFGSPNAVYPVLRNIVERLQRSREIREFLPGTP